jgi:mannose-1-phosphate guanylyltransferase/phosphomannomutase
MIGFWCLPDAGEPLVHIFGNSNDRDWLDDNLTKYQSMSKTLLRKSKA